MSLYVFYGSVHEIRGLFLLDNLLSLCYNIDTPHGGGVYLARCVEAYLCAPRVPLLRIESVKR